MTDAYVVNASSLKLRDAPITGDIITMMPRDEIVEKIGGSDVEGWWEVSTQVGSVSEQGFAASRYLAPYSPPPKGGFTFPWFRNIRASIERVQRFVGEIADNLDAEVLTTLNEVMKEHRINRNSKRFTHFMAQLAHESAGFSTLEENLNYSGEALWAKFQKYFKDPDEAQEYHRQRERIGNRIYGNRMGNGDEASGEGYLYRGRGFIQLTGKDNYRDIGERIGKNLVDDPDILIRDQITALHASAAFWSREKLNRLADKDDLKAVTKKINGGYHGLADREQKLKLAKSIWGG